MNKVTQWFYPGINPVHIGWYESLTTGFNYVAGAQGIVLLYWTGNWWRASPQSPNLANISQYRTWRGLVKRPACEALTDASQKDK